MIQVFNEFSYEGKHEIHFFHCILCLSFNWKKSHNCSEINTNTNRTHWAIDRDWDIDRDWNIDGDWDIDSFIQKIIFAQ